MAHQHQQPIARAQCVLRVRAGDLLQAEGSWTFSEPPTQIEGLQWRVAARVVNDCLEAKVCCDVGGNAIGWQCLASVRLSVKVRLADGNEWTKEHADSNVFSADAAEIWLSDNEWLISGEDNSIELETDIHADPSQGTAPLPKLDLLVINGQPIHVNKELLAAYSPFFKKLFFNPNFAEGANKVEISDPPAGVRHFERLMTLMYPDYEPVDDECVEGVLHLANQFQAKVVERVCLDFLRTKSNKPALLKYRLAEKYGYCGLKAHVLRNLAKEDFDGANFGANVRECFALGENSEGFKALLRRYHELYPQSAE